jgi:hypothetical protein
VFAAPHFEEENARNNSVDHRLHRRALQQLTAVLADLDPGDDETDPAPP